MNLPRVFLVDDAIHLDPESRRQLEPQAQKNLDAFSENQDRPNSARSVLRTILAAWLLGRGRKVRVQFELDGEIKSIEVTNVKELDDLIGDGKTPQTFLQALGNAA
jgi:hypothetical protein